jgi:hypothetical protein
VAGDDARVDQLVEHATENRSVGGSTPSPGTIGLKPGIAAFPDTGQNDRVSYI